MDKKRDEFKDGPEGWVKTLLSIQKTQNDEGLSMQEWIKATGRGRDYVTMRLRELRDQGRLRVGTRQSTRLDGSPGTVPVYRVLPAK